MFEFHGWASIGYHTHDTDTSKQNACWKALTDYITVHSGEFVSLKRYNGCDSLHLAGQHNHRNSHPFDLFNWIAENALGSYGLLYIRDDEDHARGADYRNCFRAWRLCRGQLVEMDDPFLSPAIPTVEDPWDEPLDDQGEE